MSRFYFEHCPLQQKIEEDEKPTKAKNKVVKQSRVETWFKMSDEIEIKIGWSDLTLRRQNK